MEGLEYGPPPPPPFLWHVLQPKGLDDFRNMNFKLNSSNRRKCHILYTFSKRCLQVEKKGVWVIIFKWSCFCCFYMAAKKGGLL